MSASKAWLVTLTFLVIAWTGQAYLGPVGTVFVASILGGMASGWLLWFRHWRTGMLTLAATCGGMAMIVAVTEITGGSTIGHALKVGTGLAVVCPLIGTALACLVWLLWSILRRLLKAIWTFGGNVLTDFLRIVKRQSDEEYRSQRSSKAFLITLRFLSVAGIMLFAFNIGTLWHLATRVMPRLSIITNVLDLISLVLVTPKISELLPPRTITLVFRVAIFISVYLLLLLALILSTNYTIPQLLELIEIVNKIFPSRIFDFMRKHMLENQMVSMQIWPFAKSIAIVTVVLAASMMLVSPPAKTSSQAQQTRNDKLLCWGVVVFAYSRALSMLG